MMDEGGDADEHDTVRRQLRQRALELAQCRRMGMTDRKGDSLAQRDGSQDLQLASDVSPIGAVVEKDVPADRG